MREALVKRLTAELAKKRGFDINQGGNCWVKTLDGDVIHNSDRRNTPEHDRSSHYLDQPSLATLAKWIRETRGVHIHITRNASAYHWEMCKADTGTNLGWSDLKGPNYGGGWDSYEEALENGVRVQLSKDLVKGDHWGLYAAMARKEYIKIMKSKSKK